MTVRLLITELGLADVEICESCVKIKVAKGLPLCFRAVDLEAFFP